MSDEARAYVKARGNALYLRPGRNQCCHGALEVIRASTHAPEDLTRYRLLLSDDPEIRILDAGIGLPRSIDVELRGRLRPRLIALWDGCAYRI